MTGKIPEIINKLRALAGTVPEEYRDQIEIEVECFDYYGSYTISLDAYYYRDETDQERKDRLAKGRAHQAQLDQRDRAEFERLKKKFEES